MVPMEFEPWADGAGVVEFASGRRVRGRGLGRPRPPGPDPDHALYLLDAEPPPQPYPCSWVPWPDFGLPADDHQAIEAIADLLARADRERVEVGCLGGRGRTGTALAVMAIVSGVATEDAVTWVRDNYHPDAIETEAQEQWVARVGRRQ